MKRWIAECEECGNRDKYSEDFNHETCSKCGGYSKNMRDLVEE